MAKSLLKKVAKAGRGLVRKAKVVMREVDSVALDAKAQAAARMLADPCNAPLSEACYRGDAGYRSRFVSNFSLGTGAGQTAAAVVFIPTQNTFAFVTTPTSATAGTWSVTAGPGSPFLTTNASAIRSLGACVSATPLSPNLSTSGQVYSTICSISALQGTAISGATVTIDNLLVLCNKYGKISIDEPMETKWIPASGDEEYVTPTGSADVSDVNCVLMIFVGFPAATGIVCRFTNIIEWKPASTIGIVSESYLGNPSRNTIEHVKQVLHKRDPAWWSNVGKTAYSVVRGYATGGTVGAIGAAMKATKFM